MTVESSVKRTSLLQELSSQGSRLPFYLLSSRKGYLYDLFKMQTASLDAEKRLKEEIKGALTRYSHIQAFSPEGPYILIKITGILPEEEDVGSLVYEYQMSRPFHITESAARVLCKIIKEAPFIKGLLLVCREFHKCDFCKKEEIGAFLGDSVVTVLASHLPKNRFVILRIEGYFGDAGVRAFLKKVPDLLRQTNNVLDFVLNGIERRDKAMYGFLRGVCAGVRLGRLTTEDVRGTITDFVTVNGF